MPDGQEKNPYADLYQSELQKANIAPTQTDAPAAQPPSTLQTLGKGALDLGKGVLKGAGSTANNIGHLLYPDFLAKHLTGAPSAEQQENYFKPANAPQAVGKGAEQIGEFFLPGGAEEQAGKELSLALPKLAKFAKPIARVAGIEVVNEAQGGTPGVGAATGAAGEGAGAMARMAAPYVAEAGMRIPMAARAFGRTPGKAILEETRGIRPSTIAQTAQQKLNVLNPDLEAKYAASPSTVSLKPARDYLSDQMLKAESQNAEGLHGQLNKMGNTLAQRFGTGQTIPQDVPALDALNLKRGFGEEHTSWNPEVRNRALSAGRHVYGMLDRAGDAAVPEGRELNQRISSLIPVLRAADKAERAPSLFQRSAGRLAAHTGALTLGGLGAAGGYREGGLPGAVAGGALGALGVLGPEILASPEAQMRLARSLHGSGGIRPVVASALQINRPRKTGTEGTAQ